MGFFNREMPTCLEVRQILSIALTKCGTTQIPPVAILLCRLPAGVRAPINVIIGILSIGLERGFQ
jgi:hypothetical protein